MFFASSIFSSRHPLASLWLAAHWRRKLNKSTVVSTSITDSVAAIESGGGERPLALRVSGQLLLGLVTIYDKKVRYLHDDCQEALSHLNLIIKRGVHTDPSAPSSSPSAPNVTLSSSQLIAPLSAITMAEQMEQMEVADQLENLFGASSQKLKKWMSMGGDHKEPLGDLSLSLSLSQSEDISLANFNSTRTSVGRGNNQEEDDGLLLNDGEPLQFDMDFEGVGLPPKGSEEKKSSNELFDPIELEVGRDAMAEAETNEFDIDGDVSVVGDGILSAADKRSLANTDESLSIPAPPPRRLKDPSRLRNLKRRFPPEVRDTAVELDDDEIRRNLATAESIICERPQEYSKLVNSLNKRFKQIHQLKLPEGLHSVLEAITLGCDTNDERFPLFVADELGIQSDSVVSSAVTSLLRSRLTTRALQVDGIPMPSRKEPATDDLESSKQVERTYDDASSAAAMDVAGSDFNFDESTLDDTRQDDLNDIQSHKEGVDKEKDDRSSVKTGGERGGDANEADGSVIESTAVEVDDDRNLAAARLFFNDLNHSYEIDENDSNADIAAALSARTKRVFNLISEGFAHRRGGTKQQSTLEFSTLLGDPSSTTVNRGVAAAVFYQLLVLSGKGVVKCQQIDPFGPIEMTKTSKFGEIEATLSAAASPSKQRDEPKRKQRVKQNGAHKRSAGDSIADAFNIQ